MKTNALIRSCAVALGALLAGATAFGKSTIDSLSGGCPYCNGGSGGLYGDMGGLADPSSMPIAHIPPPAPKAASTATPPTPIVPALTPAATEAAVPEPEKGADGYWKVGFEQLASYSFTPRPDDAPHQPGSMEAIPPKVRALDGKRVRLSGYMLPMKMADGAVQEFLLIRSPMVCCYGIAPQPNEWVVVKMKGKGTEPVMDSPMYFYGTLHVGELYENNTFAGLYQLDGDNVSVD